jgi:hypothetical protein
MKESLEWWKILWEYTWDFEPHHNYWVEVFYLVEQLYEKGSEDS